MLFYDHLLQQEGKSLVAVVALCCTLLPILGWFLLHLVAVVAVLVALHFLPKS